MSVLMHSAVSVSSLPESDQPRYPAFRMSAGLTSEAQLRYLLQWFNEFSELQREDFLPVLAAAKTGKPDLLADALAKLSCQDKPVSLFQCRVKLFNEWYPTWAEEEQDRLVKSISDIDPDFGSKLLEVITNGALPNGDHEAINGHYTSENENEDQHVSTENNVEVNGVDDNSAVTSNNDQNVTITHENIPVEITAAS